MAKQCRSRHAAVILPALCTGQHPAGRVHPPPSHDGDSPARDRKPSGLPGGIRCGGGLCQVNTAREPAATCKRISFSFLDSETTLLWYFVGISVEQVLRVYILQGHSLGENFGSTTTAHLVRTTWHDERLGELFSTSTSTISIIVAIYLDYSAGRYLEG